MWIIGFISSGFKYHGIYLDGNLISAEDYDTVKVLTLPNFPDAHKTHNN